MKELKRLVQLNNNTVMPTVAIGVWQSRHETEKAVTYALNHGYRHIDTASVYGNEEAVGKAIKKSNIKRESLFITTKLWNEDIRKGKTREAFEDSLKKLQLDYVDLFLIHWPVEGNEDAYLVMEELYKEGKIKAIGVSNYRKHHLEALLEKTNIVPMVNQIEYNPFIQDDETLEFCRQHHIVVEAWSPLGSGACLAVQEIQDIAQEKRKSTAQIILRWLLQKGIVVLPKSVHERRIIENINLFQFELSDDEMTIMNSLNRNQRTGPNPDRFDF